MYIKSASVKLMQCDGLCIAASVRRT